MRFIPSGLLVLIAVGVCDAKLPNRSRIVEARSLSVESDGKYRDNGLPIEGPSYRSRRQDAERDTAEINKKSKRNKSKKKEFNQHVLMTEQKRDVILRDETPEEFERKLSSQLTGCCYTYQSYSADELCELYGQDCQSGETPSHDSGDEECSHDGLSFIGISFSVNTANGNPYSYQLCDQFPMENIIERDYDYVMSMDEDGWLVGGGYKSFDYSGKMPYIDSSHTELLRIGNMDPDSGYVLTSHLFYAAATAIRIFCLILPYVQTV